MSEFKRAFSAEWLKIRKRIKYKVLFLILLAIYAAAAFVSAYFASGVKQGIALEGLILNVFMPLVMFLGANDLIAGEIRLNSIHLAASSPVSRTKLFLAKFLAVFLNAAAPAVIICAIDTVLSFFGWSLAEAYQLLYLTIDFVPAAALAAFACCVSLAVAAPAFSMLICLCAYIAMRLTGVFTGFSPALFTSYFEWHLLFIGGMNFKSLVVRILAVASPLTFFLSAGAYMMERKRF